MIFIIQEWFAMQKGKESARGYYEDAHDYTAFKERLLMPLGPNGIYSMKRFLIT